MGVGDGGFGWWGFQFCRGFGWSFCFGCSGLQFVRIVVVGVVVMGGACSGYGCAMVFVVVVVVAMASCGCGGGGLCWFWLLFIVLNRGF